MLKYIIISIILVLSISYSKGSSIRRYFFNGVLYEDYTPESKSVTFVRTADSDWKSLSSLVKKNKLTYKSVFCTLGNGAWLVYPEKDYQYGKSMTFQIMIGEECLTAEDVESVQPLGLMNQKLTSGLFTFTSPYFTSPVKVVKSGSSSGMIKSLFQIGSSNWTVEGTGVNGTVKYCMKRGFSDDGKSLCSISDIEVQLGITGSLSIKEGCEEKAKILNLQTCYTRGSYKIVVEKDITLANVQEICKSGMSSTEKVLLHKFIKLMEIWDARIRNKIGNPDSRLKLAPDDVDTKIYMFWKIMKVFDHGCENVSPGYLGILGSIFQNHLQRAWTLISDPQLVREDRWPEINNYLQMCSDHLGNQGIDVEPMTFDKNHPTEPEPDYVFQGMNETDRKPAKGRRAKRDVETVGIECRTDSLGMMEPGPNQDAMQYMLAGTNYDAVIEQVWLIFNFVNPFCSDANDYKDNIWAHFASLLRNNYLNPVKDQWLKPGEWSHIYPSMFNGYDMEAEKTNIISCVQSLMMHSDHFNLISRIIDELSNNKTVKVPSSTTTPTKPKPIETKKAQTPSKPKEKEIKDAKKPEDNKEKPAGRSSSLPKPSKPSETLNSTSKKPTLTASPITLSKSSKPKPSNFTSKNATTPGRSMFAAKPGGRRRGRGGRRPTGRRRRPKQGRASKPIATNSTHANSTVKQHTTVPTPKSAISNSTVKAAVG